MSTRKAPLFLPPDRIPRGATANGSLNHHLYWAEWQLNGRLLTVKPPSPPPLDHQTPQTIKRRAGPCNPKCQRNRHRRHLEPPASVSPPTPVLAVCTGSVRKVQCTHVRSNFQSRAAGGRGGNLWEISRSRQHSVQLKQWRKDNTQQCKKKHPSTDALHCSSFR